MFFQAESVVYVIPHGVNIDTENNLSKDKIRP